MKNKEKQTKKEKSLRRFYALDAVIILLILAAVVGIYFRFNVLDVLTSNRDLKEYHVSFSIENIRYSTPNYMNINDRVYYMDSGEELGVLIEGSTDMSNMAAIVTPASELFMNEEGVMVEVPYPNSESRVDVKGRILCKGSYTEDGGFLVNGSRYLSAGQTISVQTELITVNIIIQSIDPVQ